MLTNSQQLLVNEHEGFPNCALRCGKRFLFGRLDLKVVFLYLYMGAPEMWNVEAVGGEP